jgi:hypothetical protein
LSTIQLQYDISFLFVAYLHSTCVPYYE